MNLKRPLALLLLLALFVLPLTATACGFGPSGEPSEPTESGADTTAAPDPSQSAEVTTEAQTEETAEESTEESTAESTAPEVTTEDLSALNALRPDCGFGTCQNLSGKITVLIYYMDDAESSWTEEQVYHFTNQQVRPALAFLEAEAKKYRVSLSFEVGDLFMGARYFDDVIVSPSQTGLVTVDVLDQAAYCFAYGTANKMHHAINGGYDGDEIIYLTVFNKNGTSYALNPKRGDPDAEGFIEHAVIFAYDLTSDRTDPVGSQASIVANQILYLYGAESLSKNPNRKMLASLYYPNDIMLRQDYAVRKNEIGAATAFYVGWTDRVPEAMRENLW